jgi:hypothetical protein
MFEGGGGGGTAFRLLYRLLRLIYKPPFFGEGFSCFVLVTRNTIHILEYAVLWYSEAFF